ncbi:hypothetical protein D0469_05665 [Peribacillus saganii]|uniref:Uncharacterized protein n=1 Tax=Peribacillus saganii TaxID=2303992 RepID=A0A372LQZ2_9BACI|nr:hypothetical protein D0469_05665 [Peribacillus saganii]
MNSKYSVSAMVMVDVIQHLYLDSYYLVYRNDFMFGFIFIFSLIILTLKIKAPRIVQLTLPIMVFLPKPDGYGFLQ